MLPGLGEGVRGGIQLAAFFTTHTLDHLLSQFGYAAVFAFVMVESLGVPFPGETMLITAALYASLTHHLSRLAGVGGRGGGGDHRRPTSGTTAATGWFGATGRSCTSTRQS